MTNSAYAKNNRVDLLYRLVFCDMIVISSHRYDSYIISSVISSHRNLELIV